MSHPMKVAVVLFFIVSLILISGNTVGQKEGIYYDNDGILRSDVVYDGYALEITLVQRFQITWPENVYVYFKILPGQHDLYRKGNITTGQGWYVTFIIGDSSGDPLDRDANGNKIKPELGTRTDDTPSRSVLLSPGYYSMILRIHVPSGLAIGGHYTGSVAICLHSPSDVQGSGATQDTAREVGVFLTMVNTLPVYGTVNLHGDGVENATVRIKNTRTGEEVKLKTVGGGFFKYDLGNFMKGWKRGDRIEISASYEGYTSKIERKIDIYNPEIEVNIELSHAKEDNTFMYLSMAMLVLLAIALVIFTGRRSGLIPTHRESTIKRKETPRKERFSRSGRVPPRYRR